MATESIGKTVYMDNEFADRFIAQMERFEKNPPVIEGRETPWGDSKKIAKAIKEKYGYEG